MSNERIREAAKRKGLKLWQVADRMGMNDGNFSRMMRKELPEERQREILALIDELAGGGEEHETEDI